jgi:hypothetical protein
MLSWLPILIQTSTTGQRAVLDEKGRVSGCGPLRSTRQFDRRLTSRTGDPNIAGIWFRTVNGSEYAITMGPPPMWKRISKDKRSGEIRSDHGELTKWPNIEVGKEAVLWDCSVLAGHVAHAVMTSEVLEMKVLEEEI